MRRLANVNDAVLEVREKGEKEYINISPFRLISF